MRICFFFNLCTDDEHKLLNSTSVDVFLSVLYSTSSHYLPLVL